MMDIFLFLFAFFSFWLGHTLGKEKPEKEAKEWREACGRAYDTNRELTLELREAAQDRRDLVAELSKLGTSDPGVWFCLNSFNEAKFSDSAGEARKDAEAALKWERDVCCGPDGEQYGDVTNIMWGRVFGRCELDTDTVGDYHIVNRNYFSRSRKKPS